MSNRLSQIIIGGLAVFAVAGTAIPVAAQNSGDEARLRKLEAEMRAIQRKVFSGANGRYFEPQITGTQTASGVNNTPSTTAVTDILIRLDAMEAQISSLTAQIEQNTNGLLQVTNRIVALETAPVAARESRDLGTSGAGPTDIMSAAGASTATVAAASNEPTAERIASVQQITKPQTDDAADDEYSYGYRLWNAGFFPEAQQQLSLFVEKNPSHWRTTYGRNLLGRAYLDDGKAREAASWFLKNYQAGKTDARAPDSLLYLGEAMIAIGDTSRACIAFAEFGDEYPAIASGRLSKKYQRNLEKVDCN